jgi:hypothetical protein
LNEVPFTFAERLVSLKCPPVFPWPFCKSILNEDPTTMATKASRKTGSKPQHPIRVVPMRGAAVSTAAAGANLTYRNGPLLSAVKVFTVFWGTGWQEAVNATLMNQLNQFFDYILTSQLMDQLGEYSVPGKTIGQGSRIGTTVLTSPDVAAQVQDADVQRLLQASIDAGTLPAADANTLYFVYLPPGVQVQMGGSASCTTFCGYHDTFGNQIFYAVMPYPGCSGCTGSLALFDALTSISSHELCEAVTDPIPGQGWYDDAQGEIGDICAWQNRKLGAYTVQLEWSNQAGACI